LKLLEENTGETIQDISAGKDILNMSPIAQEIKTRIDIKGLHEIKSFCTVKETINQPKSHLQNERENLPAIHLKEVDYTEFVMHSRIIPVNKWANGLNRPFSEVQVPNL
jgi:hypothetical protein